MSCDMTKSVFIILLLLLSIACGGTELDPDSSQDPFKNHLINTFSGITIHKAIHPGSDLIYEASWLILPEDHGKLIIYDRADYTLKLLNRDGEILSTGGGQGRGPGEFGDYARFYPVDAMNHRIHLYEVKDDSIELIRTQTIKFPATYYLSTLYIRRENLVGC